MISVVTLAAIIASIVEVCKRAGLRSNWAGVLAVIAGVVIAVSLNLTGVPDYSTMKVGEAAMAGLIAGLTAAGAYSSVKAASNPR